MTIAEAEQILDIVRAALEDNSHPYGQHPISTLRGYDMLSIVRALKLRIANEFLQLAQRADFEQQFAEGLRLYGSIPWQIMRSFVADNQIGVFGAKLVLSPIDPSTMESPKEDAVSTEEHRAARCELLAADLCAHRNRIHIKSTTWECSSDID